MSDFEKFKEKLPSKEKFYSSLTGKKVDEQRSGKEDEHVLNVWEKFEIKAMKDYHDLYLKCDALLTADVFDKFGNSSLNNYELCRSHYLNATALSWDVMLNIKKVELGFIPDPEKVREVEFLVFLIDIVKPTISI